MDYAHQEHKLSLRQAFILFLIHPSVYYYKPKPNTDHLVRAQLAELAEIHTRWGFWMMYYRLRGLDHHWNHKRVYRIYKEMGLNMRRKYKKRLPTRVMEPLVQPLFPNVTWSMDFMHDGLTNGIKFRAFNIIDDFNREALNITIDTSLTCKRVIRELDHLIAWRGTPERIRVDNGPEFIATAMNQWAHERGIELKFIENGKPYQNGYMERFNRSFREEVLGAFSFTRIMEAQILANAWIWIYNNERPHSSCGYKTPRVFAQERLRLYETPTFLPDRSFEWKSLLLNATV